MSVRPRVICRGDSCVVEIELARGEAGGSSHQEGKTDYDVIRRCGVHLSCIRCSLCVPHNLRACAELVVEVHVKYWRAFVQNRAGAVGQQRKIISERMCGDCR